MQIHPIQQKILKLSLNVDINGLSLRQIGKLIELNDVSPQRVKHHILQLKKKGLLRPFSSRFVNEKNSVVDIPVYGSANCGKATLLADNNIEGYISVSQSLVPQKASIYALKAVGNSMNDSKVPIYNQLGKTRSIEDGDYVIVDSSVSDPASGSYVVSIINDAANIKRIVKDSVNQQVVLLSESTENYNPIFIDSNDSDSYSIAGIVIGVIKTPKLDI